MSRHALEIVCHSGARCGQCRDTTPAAQAWRESLARYYDVPADWPTCPHGKALGDLAPWVPPVMNPAKSYATVSKVEPYRGTDCPECGRKGPTPAEIEAELERQGYDPSTVKHRGCCDPPILSE